MKLTIGLAKSVAPDASPVRMYNRCSLGIFSELAMADAFTAPMTWSEWKKERGRMATLLPIGWACEHIVYWSRRSDFVKLLELAGKFTILFAAVAWLVNAPERAKERHYRAWGVINAAKDQTGDGGRKDALKDLNDDQVSLYAAQLDNAYLDHVDLSNAQLSSSRLKDSNLTGAELNSADLSSADLRNATLANADLDNAKLKSSFLSSANLISAKLRGADLRDADLTGADLRNASLNKAKLNNSVLTGVNLTGADLTDADLTGAIIDLDDIKVTKALFCRTLMPDSQINKSNC